MPHINPKGWRFVVFVMYPYDTDVLCCIRVNVISERSIYIFWFIGLISKTMDLLNVKYAHDAVLCEAPRIWRILMYDSNMQAMTGLKRIVNRLQSIAVEGPVKFLA